MDVLDRMRADRMKVSGELEDLSRQKAEIDAKERDARARLAELENALRVAERYAGEAVSSDTPPVSAEALTSEKLTADEALWRVFSERHGGAKLADMVESAEKRYGVSINPKTAGNYFWNWKIQGRARREGYTWFPVRPQ